MADRDITTNSKVDRTKKDPQDQAFGKAAADDQAAADVIAEAGVTAAGIEGEAGDEPLRDPAPPRCRQGQARLTPIQRTGSRRTPGLRMPAGSSAPLAADNADANRSGRCWSYQGR